MRADLRCPGAALNKPTAGNAGGTAAARGRSLSAGVVGLAALAVLLTGATAAPGFFTHMGNLVFDAYQRMKPREPAGAPIAVVDIDEASLGEIGQWPWPRDRLAAIVDRLGAYGAAAIAFDMVLPEPDRTSPLRAVEALEEAGAQVIMPKEGTVLDNDAVLARAFSKNPVVAGIAISNETQAALSPPKAGFAFGGGDPKSYLPDFSGGADNLHRLSEAASGLGFFSFPGSSDGIVRALPLVSQSRDRLYPALSIEALRVAQGAGSFVARSTGASGEMDSGHPAMTALKVGNFAMPTGPASQFRIYYSGLPDLTTVSAATLLTAEPDAALRQSIAGHIVLIGSSAVGLRDLVATPIDQAMPGVRAHAEIIDQIMGQTFLARPDWARGAEICAALLLGLIILVVVQRSGALVSSAVAAGLIAFWLAASWVAFSQKQFLLDPILPGLAVALVFAATMPVLLLVTDREKRFIRGAFGRYLSPSLVSRLADRPQSLALGGETRELTILFSDIRGFTSLSQHLDPQDLTTLLNDMLTPATDVLLEAEATIDKYIGDAIMAFWNAPLDIPDHRRKACLAALALQEAIATLNRERGLSLAIGVGLHTGQCCVGNLGSAQRFSYSAIGDSVNLASRVEGLTKEYGVPVLVTEETRTGAPELAFLEADRVKVVGRDMAVTIHVLAGDAELAASPAFARLADAHAAFLAAYRDGDLSAAEPALASARATAPERLGPFYTAYGQRLEAMRTEPARNWDGVHVAKRK